MPMHDSIVKQFRRNHTAMLQALAKVSQERVAELIGVSAPTISVFKNEYVERFCAVLAAAGLKVVDEAEQCTPSDEMWALRILAAKRIEQDVQNSGFGSLG